MTEQNQLILLVDDDPRNVRLLEGIFRAAGYRVAKAHDGYEALRLAGTERPDLILLDVMMPRLSGHEVCAKLKADPATRAIPVIMVTALSSLEEKVGGLEVGADDFVSKPVNRIELMARARSLLRAKALHDELAHARDELERKNAELTRVEELKESLVQMVVHDLKNPLTAIMGNLELLQGRLGEEPERDRERIGRSVGSSRSMMRMILDLLDVARLEENRFPLALGAFDAAALVEERAAEIEGIARTKCLEIRRRSEPGLPPVRADRSLVGRILGNLLSNSLKHTPSGGSVTIAVERAGEGVAFLVEDTGEGIPPEFQPFLFQKFAQAHLRRHGLATDRGLGLAFCKLAAEAHGGSMQVDSEPGRGSLFRLVLPRAFAAGGDVQAVPERERELVGV